MTGFTVVPPLALLAGGAHVLPIAIGAFAFGTGMMFGNAVWESALQRHIRPDALSRVSAHDWFGSFAFAPVGLAIWGPIAQSLGHQRGAVARGRRGARVDHLSDVRARRATHAQRQLLPAVGLTRPPQSDPLKRPSSSEQIVQAAKQAFAACASSLSCSAISRLPAPIQTPSESAGPDHPIVAGAGARASRHCAWKRSLPSDLRHPEKRGAGDVSRHTCRWGLVARLAAEPIRFLDEPLWKARGHGGAPRGAV